MEGRTPVPSRSHPRGSRRARAQDHEDSRQLLYLHGRLVLEECGFTAQEIGRLVFLKWLHQRGDVAESLQPQRKPAAAVV